MTTPDHRTDQPTHPLRVLVVGGGIGGLALAAGLRRRGTAVTVLDRDTDVRATGGYHITLDGPAQAALRRLVPPQTLQRLLASASALRLREPDAFFDRRGRLLGHGPDLGTDPGVDVDRITLRALLAEAVGDSLRLGCVVTAVEHGEDGRPGVRLADGSVITADLVVGADGAHSVVARQLAGAPTSRPAGILGFSGRTDVAALPTHEQTRLGPRSSLAMGPHGAALYVGFLDPVGRAVLDAPELSAAVSTGPTYIWGAMFPDAAPARALRELSGPALGEALVARFVELGWRREALQVIARTDADTAAGFRFNAASTEPVDLAPWPAGDVTALGDAVHATPPTAGMGAGAAIRDADALLSRLRTVEAGTTTLWVAVSDFEADMRLRGEEVLTAAMRTVGWILATDTVPGSVLTTATLPLLAGARRLTGRRRS